MDKESLAQLLHQVAAKEQTVESALRAIGKINIGDVEGAQIDFHRELRCGWPEVIFGAGKTVDQIRRISRSMIDNGCSVFVTRLAKDAATILGKEFADADYDELAATLRIDVAPVPARPGRAGVVTAGTSDAPVAREAHNTLRFFGYEPELIEDVGVAGIHRVLRRQDTLRELDVVIVVAGMDGALPSVVGGLVASPVIAVPTSVGYGVAGGGAAALLSMLASCASGLTVVNIDNGFGAACAAARVLGLPLRHD